MNKEGFKKLCLPVKEDLLAWLHQQLSEYYGLANTVTGAVHEEAAGRSAAAAEA